jgi:hypothetical protein
MAMEMAVDSMEMTPRAIPYPDRVSEQRLLSPEIGLRWRQRCGTFPGWMPIHLGFSRQRQFIGRGVMSEGTQRGHATRWRGQRGTRHPMVWPAPGSPPGLLYTPSSCQQNRRFGFRFVQFREYFLYNFSEIQK